MRELIRLISSAGTGHFYTTDKTSARLRTKSKSKNSIRLFVST